MKKLDGFEFMCCGKVCHFRVIKYSNGNNVAIEIFTDLGEPMGKLTVNIPNGSIFLRKGEFFVKTWSENNRLSKEAFQTGLFQNTGKTCPIGFVKAEIWTLNNGVKLR